MSLSAKIKQAREDKALTQKELADACLTSSSIISRMERGTVGNAVSREKARMVVDYLQIKYQEKELTELLTPKKAEKVPEKAEISQKEPEIPKKEPNLPKKGLDLNNPTLKPEGREILVQKGPDKSISESDQVKDPAHYQGASGLDVRTVQENFVPGYKECGGMVAHDIGNVIKYILRAPKKNGLEDLKKARQYLDWAISSLEDQVKEPEK